MSYKYERGLADYIKVSTANGELYLEIMNETRGSYPCANIIIPNEDAPRVALEILKAAGWVTTSGSIGGELEAVARANEQKSQHSALLKRRDELARELSEWDLATYSDRTKATRRAIDRIIELESKP